MISPIARTGHEHLRCRRNKPRSPLGQPASHDRLIQSMHHDPFGLKEETLGGAASHQTTSRTWDTPPAKFAELRSFYATYLMMEVDAGIALEAIPEDCGGICWDGLNGCSPIRIKFANELPVHALAFLAPSFCA